MGLLLCSQKVFESQGFWEGGSFQILRNRDPEQTLRLGKKSFFFGFLLQEVMFSLFWGHL